MQFTYFKQGDIIPADGLLKILLNSRDGAPLHLDEIFGPKTRAAVCPFQKTRGLNSDGIVVKKTWPFLAASVHNLKIIDCIGVFEPRDMQEARDIWKS